MKKPPTQPIKSIQYDLFSQFVANDPNQISNSVEFWESIPKYFFTSRQVEKLRTKDGLAQSYKWNYVYNDTNFTVKVQPALVEEKAGESKAFFPGVTEELVEEALKKILADQQCGIHDPHQLDTWVKFSLRMVQRELQEKGRTRSISEIKHAIEVMSGCVITFSKEGKEIWRGSILQDLVTVNRKEYLTDTDAHHIARLPLFISQSINHLEYRQFNYERLMHCNEQLSRWIYKQLIHRFRQANLLNNYHFMYSGIKNSGLLMQQREIDNRRKVISALNELIKQNALIKYEANEFKKGRKILDIKYIVYPSSEFVSEQKAANKRIKNNHETVQNKGAFIN